MSIQFVIVGAPRTGSTLLVKTLNNLAGVCCHGEILGPDKVRGYEDGFDLLNASQSARKEREQRLLQQREQDPVAFVKHALSSANTATGLKIIYSQFLEPRWVNVIQNLLAEPEIRFIHLARNNNLRRYISEQIARSGGPIHSGTGGQSEKTTKVHIDVAAYLQNSAQVELEVQQITSALSPKKIMAITYEELSANTATTVAQVCQFLGLERVPSDIEPALKKVGATDLRDSVSNYQDLLDNPVTRALALAD